MHWPIIGVYCLPPSTDRWINTRFLTIGLLCHIIFEFQASYKCLLPPTYRWINSFNTHSLTIYLRSSPLQLLRWTNHIFAKKCPHLIGPCRPLQIGESAPISYIMYFDAKVSDETQCYYAALNSWNLACLTGCCVVVGYKGHHIRAVTYVKESDLKSHPEIISFAFFNRRETQSNSVKRR